LEKPIEQRINDRKAFKGSMQRGNESLVEATEFFVTYDATPEEERYHNVEAVEKIRKMFEETKLWFEQGIEKWETMKCTDTLPLGLEDMATRFTDLSFDVLQLKLLKKPEPKKVEEEVEKKAEEGEVNPVASETGKTEGEEEKLKEDVHENIIEEGEKVVTEDKEKEKKTEEEKKEAEQEHHDEL